MKVKIMKNAKIALLILIASMQLVEARYLPFSISDGTTTFTDVKKVTVGSSTLTGDNNGATLNLNLSGATLAAATGIGTAGSIFFAGATGTLSQNNSQLFWNNSTTNLGIGTATPSQKLDVIGSVKATSFIGDGANLTNISAGALASNSVTSAKITDGTIVTADLADSSVTDAKIVGIAASKITGTVANATNAVSATTAATAVSATTASTVTDNAITSAKILDGTIATVDLADALITTAKLADGSVVNIDISASAAIAGTKISPDFGSQNVITTGTVNGGTLAANKLRLRGGTTGQVLNYLANGTAAWTTISVSSSNLSDASITTAKLVDSAVTSVKIADGTIATADLADSSVTDAKITGVSGSKVSGTVANATNAVSATTATTVSDNAITSTKILDGTIATADLADSLITTAKLADGSIVNADINASAAIAGSKISPDFGSQNVITTGTVNGGTLAANKLRLRGGTAGQMLTYQANGTAIWSPVGSSAITDGSITTVKLADSAITSIKITDGTIATADLADASVTDAKISGIAASKITGTVTNATNAVNATTAATAVSATTASTVSDNAITSAKILDGTIATADLADASITNAKIASVDVSKITGTISATSAASADIATGELNATRGIAAAIVTKTASYTATSSDYTILVDATAGAVTITLPAAASSSRRMYHIKKIDSSNNAVIVDANASETIDGSLTRSLTMRHESSTLHCNGTGWFGL